MITAADDCIASFPAQRPSDCGSTSRRAQSQRIQAGQEACHPAGQRALLLIVFAAIQPIEHWPLSLAWLV
jgi:hypothetical protein